MRSDFVSERVQKYLARAGFGSRRSIEKLLMAGSITSGDHTLKPGDRVEVGDELIVEGIKIVVSAADQPTRLIAYHKAEGEICTHKDPGKRRRALDSLPDIEDGRWLSVGRLDINTTGLLLFSNDGELVNALMHPSNQIEREYMCRVYGEVSAMDLARLCEGIQSGDDILRFNSITTVESTGTNFWFKIILTGGKNREIRRAWQELGCVVSRLKRIRYGHFSLPLSLKVGQWIELGDEEIQYFRKISGLSTSRPSAINQD